jgi:hypothetical protein
MPRFAAIVFALLLAASPAAAAQWDRTFEVKGRPTVVLRADDAGVRVTAWDRPTVGIRVVTRGWSIGSGGIRVSATRSGDRIECEVREPQHWLSFSFNVNRQVSIEVSVPRQADLDLSTGDGSVSLAPLEGSVRVHTGDGGIEAEGLRGDVRLSTADGHIRALGLDGALDARSGDGAVEIDGRFDDLRLRTSDGRVTATVRPGSRLAGGWSIESGDGSLTLRLPADLKADLSVHSGDGGVRSDLPIETTGRLGRNDLSGRLNGGGPTLDVRTGDGPIRIERS